jgi:hypothetical protein
MLLVCAMVALLALPAAASAAAGKTAEVRLSTIKLEASNGYEIEISALPESWISPAVAAVTVDNGSSRATYEVKPEAGAGIHAMFGSLGQLDVTFERKSKTVETPEPGCQWITEKGVFRGSFRFTGEGGYVTSEASDLSGEVTRLSNGFCGLGSDDRLARSAIPGLRETVLDAKAKEGNRSVFFEASRLEQSRAVLFRAVLRERVGEMKIWRSAHTAGRSWRFSNGGTGAGVSPPQPFLGTAKFRDPVNGPPTWNGSLAVSFPGAPDTPLTGGSFGAKLCPRLAILRHCLREPAGGGL